MALVNHILFISNGLVITYDYDDVSLQIDAINIDNKSGRAWQVSATSTSTGKNYTFDITEGLVNSFNVPPGAANRLSLSITPSGKLDGMEWSIW